MEKYNDTTKYFILEKDRAIQNTPIVRNNFTDAKYSKYFVEKKYSKFPNFMVLPTLEIHTTSFQDVMLYPFLMLKSKLLCVIKILDSSIEFKQVMISNKFQNEIYGLPLIQRVNCLTENSKISSNKKHLLYAELDYKKISNFTIFYIDGLTEDYVVVREDLAEGLLELGISGIVMSEVNVSR